MLTGSCLCGGVAYEVDAAIGPIAHCHCATCRKAHGSAFSSVSSVPRDKFRWTKGANLTDRPKVHIWRSQGASWLDPKDQLLEMPEGFA
jgi:hypothetical protein